MVVCKVVVLVVCKVGVECMEGLCKVECKGVCMEVG